MSDFHVKAPGKMFSIELLLRIREIELSGHVVPELMTVKV